MTCNRVGFGAYSQLDQNAQGPSSRTFDTTDTTCTVPLRRDKHVAPVSTAFRRKQVVISTLARSELHSKATLPWVFGQGSSLVKVDMCSIYTF